MAAIYRRNVANPQRIFHGRAVVDRLNALGIPVPDEVAASADRCAALTARGRDVADEQFHRRQAVDALLADPSVDIDEMVAAELAATTAANVVLQATDAALLTLRATVEQHADTLVASVRSTLFDPAAEELQRAAKSPVGATTAVLLREGDTRTAKALAGAPDAAARLHEAYKLRASIYSRSGIERLTHNVWRNAHDLEVAGQDSPLDYYLAGLRAGGELWFGTFAEVDALSREHGLKPTPPSGPGRSRPFAVGLAA